MTMPSCSFRISAPSYYKVEEENSICSAVPCILYSLQGQRKIVSDVQPSVGTQLGRVIAISGQTKLDGRYSCDSSEDNAFVETLRRSKMPNDEEEVLTEVPCLHFRGQSRRLEDIKV